LRAHFRTGRPPAEPPQQIPPPALAPPARAPASRDTARAINALSSLQQDELLRRVSASQAAAADMPLGGIGTAIGRVLPATVRQAAGMRVEHPRLWAADVVPFRGRKTDPDYLARVRAGIRAHRAPGDPKGTTLMQAAVALSMAVRQEKEGHTRRTFKQIAGAMLGACVDTARRCVRWLERYDLLDTFNVMDRAHGIPRFDANLYVIPDPPAADPEPAEDSRGARVRHYAAAFGLQVRRWGLNTTAALVGRRPVPERPSTA
jgi:hypothetical protein